MRVFVNGRTVRIFHNGNNICVFMDWSRTCNFMNRCRCTICVFVNRMEDGVWNWVMGHSVVVYG